MVITSKDNGKVKYIRSLKEKKYRKAEQRYLVEGFKMVKEAFSSGAEVETLIVAESALNKLSADFFGKTEVMTVTDGVFKKISDSLTPQGVAAVIKIGRKADAIGEVSVMLDGVSDPGNMGTIIRTLAALGVKRLYLINCCDPYSPKAVRSSMSGIYFVDIIETDLASALKDLGDTPILAADMSGENVFEFDPPKRYCLVIGNEANGISNDVKTASRALVTIPMSGKTESLNAAGAAAIAIYEYTKQRYGYAGFF